MVTLGRTLLFLVALVSSSVTVHAFYRSPPPRFTDLLLTSVHRLCSSVPRASASTIDSSLASAFAGSTGFWFFFIWAFSFCYFFCVREHDDADESFLCLHWSAVEGAEAPRKIRKIPWEVFDHRFASDTTCWLGHRAALIPLVWSPSVALFSSSSLSFLPRSRSTLSIARLLPVSPISSSPLFIVSVLVFLEVHCHCSGFCYCLGCFCSSVPLFVWFLLLTSASTIDSSLTFALAGSTGFWFFFIWAFSFCYFFCCGSMTTQMNPFFAFTGQLWKEQKLPEKSA
ncbi:hypothetical protein HN873_040805, partial [Arachis hypogaea]